MIEDTKQSHGCKVVLQIAISQKLKVHGFEAAGGSSIYFLVAVVTK